MSFTTYEQGLQLATDLANRAVLCESQLSTLPSQSSPIPTLLNAFPQYIAAAATYSHLLSSSLVPSTERANLTKKWRLVLERAEKIKRRIEQLGGQVGKVATEDRLEEDAIRRRGGVVNGVLLEEWRTPSDRGFEGEQWRDERQPELTEDQLSENPVWMAAREDAWKDGEEAEMQMGADKTSKWIISQGRGADCSLVSGLGVCVLYESRWGRSVCLAHPPWKWMAHNRPARSDIFVPSSSISSTIIEQWQTCRQVMDQRGVAKCKYRYNGTDLWLTIERLSHSQIPIDALLPISSTSHRPLVATCYSSFSPSSTLAWFPLLCKAYVKVLGGYTIPGSNPSPDIYAFTGWIPERISLGAGFQREKEWRRVQAAWTDGTVLITLGTGESVQNNSLVSRHTYGVAAELFEENGERWLEIFDPGLPRENEDSERSSGYFRRSWDAVCTDFDALFLNWDPDLRPTTARRHWSWPKPSLANDNLETTSSSPRYSLSVTAPAETEIWILLSQHMMNKDRKTDDVALHVYEQSGDGTGKSTVLQRRSHAMSPYTNGMHTLVRYTIPRANTNLLVMASRDRGVFQTDFTLQAFAPKGNAGGHAGYPSHMINPQYRLDLSAQTRSSRKAVVRIILRGEKDLPWNVKMVHGRGELVFEMDKASIVADSGAYSYGTAYLDIAALESECRIILLGGNVDLSKDDIYTLVVSTYETRRFGKYTLSVEADFPLVLKAIPPEGAGMYSRVIKGRWTAENSGGRPSTGDYMINPKIEIMLSQPGTLTCRLHLPVPSTTPLNLTLFKRGTGASLGDQVVTTGPYAESICGVSTNRFNLDRGVYLLIPSAYERGMKGDWVVNVWSNANLSAELLE
ncbi:calpain-7, partial [Tremellales sp. Uapishka_1]